MKLIILPKERLEPLDENPRRHADKHGPAKLKALILEHGFQSPLQVWRDQDGSPDDPYIILCGNHRFYAGVDLNMDTFPCIEYKGSRDMALARAVSDNKSAEWTVFDDKRLSELLSEINLDDDTSLGTITGLDSKELDKFLRDTDKQFDDDPAEKRNDKPTASQRPANKTQPAPVQFPIPSPGEEHAPGEDPPGADPSSNADIAPPGEPVIDEKPPGADPNSNIDTEPADPGGAPGITFPANEPQKTPLTKNGEVWILGSHRLVCGETNLLETDHLINEWQSLTGVEPVRSDGVTWGDACQKSG